MNEDTNCENNDNIKTFILVFMAIIWRRVLITSLIYCEHNKVKICKDIILKALKFNIYSPVGITNIIKPYINKALKDGFLMPRDYRKNIYVTRAIKLYKDGYDVIKSNVRLGEIDFLSNYALTIFSTDEADIKLVDEEKKDILEYVGDDHLNDIIDERICTCKLCDLVNSWDINEELVLTDDPFQHTVMKGLTIALDATY